MRLSFGALDASRGRGAPRRWLRHATLAVPALLLGLGAGWWGSGRLWSEAPPDPAQIPGLLWPNPRPIAAFSLADHHGRAFTRERLEGAWTFLFFGYTYCPDFCPTTLATLRQVEAELSGHASAPRQHVLVSVDPRRDSPKRLSEYLTWFGTSFLGVTGSEDELSMLARQVGAVYIPGETREDGSYLIDHTASILLIDPEGRFVALFGTPHHAGDIASRFLEIERLVLAAG